MQAIIGIIFHFIGGFASGSFYVPFKKVRGWSWEVTGSLADYFHGSLFRQLLHGLLCLILQTSKHKHLHQLFGGRISGEYFGVIYICGRAGVLKERELSGEKKKESVKKFNLVKGLIVCIISGILSACFNFGIEAGSSVKRYSLTFSAPIIVFRGWGIDSKQARFAINKISYSRKTYYPNY